jgi:L-seryl-tRNA(Ser) seleniumtransferase
MDKQNTQALFRQIPAVDRLLAMEGIEAASHGLPSEATLRLIREELNTIRKTLTQNEDPLLVVDGTLSLERIEARVIQRFQTMREPSLRPVINGTGIVLHTNFGRAPLSERALEAIAKNSSGYSNLEYDLALRGRGSRHAHVEKLLQTLLGVEAALVVNNCAAAVLLGIAAMAKGKEVVVSRGELVEIGGSFRIPEVMESAGAKLREVGTTNRTHLHDYENAIGPETGLLLKAYRSNFEIVGFTEEVSTQEMVQLGNEHGVPTMMDLGSGLLTDLTPYGIHSGTQVQAILNSGIHLTCFSGDKLLGGPQCGILVGSKPHMDILKKHPMTRALRVDKMIYSALEATLSAYLDGTWRETIPSHRMLTSSLEEEKARAAQLMGVLHDNVAPKGSYSFTPVDTEGKVGGGTLPLEILKGAGVCISHQKRSPNSLEVALRGGKVPMIGRVTNEGVIFDTRTLFESQFVEIATRLTEIERENEGDRSL